MWLNWFWDRGRPLNWRRAKPLILNWSYPPGLNRRPADYE
jgi:hypothetical protein